MAFRVPTFNLDALLWTAPAQVSDEPTRGFRANLTHGRRMTLGAEEWGSVMYLQMEMYLLCPKLTAVRASAPGVYGDVVEVPAGSGRYYVVTGVDDVAKGFANEYRMAVLLQAWGWTLQQTTNPWGVPGWPDPLP